jgi:hypothetical protein
VLSRRNDADQLLSPDRKELAGVPARVQIPPSLTGTGSRRSLGKKAAEVADALNPREVSLAFAFVWHLHR